MRWKQIRDFNYEISDTGQVRHLKHKRILKVWKWGNTKYLMCYLYVHGKQTSFSVHRLAAEAFVLNPYNKKEVNHKDGNKLNNAADNLQWVTRSENMQHMYDTSLKTYQPLHYKGKTGFDHNRSIAIKCSNGKLYGSMSEAARDLGISVSSISAVLKENRSLQSGICFNII